MHGKYVFIAFLATLVALVLIIGFGIAAVALDLKNPDAFELFAAAITGLLLLAGNFIPRKDDKE